VGAIGGVAADRDSPLSGSLDERDGSVELRFRARGDGDAGALGGKMRRDGAAESTAATGNDCNFSVEPMRHEFHRAARERKGNRTRIAANEDFSTKHFV